jgi:hypothetical protein
MSKESEKELKKPDQGGMGEESHRLELKEGHMRDEKYDEPEEQIPNLSISLSSHKI